MVSGKEYRLSLRKCLPIAKCTVTPRLVPAFTIQAIQRNTKVIPGKREDPFSQKAPKSTLFRKFYCRGDFPISIEFGSIENQIGWKVAIDKLDYHHYLPMFFDGLSEIKYPYKFFARQGIYDMVEAGPNKVLPVLPQIILPIKKALNTRHREVICTTLRVIQHIVMSCDMLGEALVPYYRQILPICNLFITVNVNIMDEIDYTYNRGENVADLIEETLQTLERYGGEDAFINIKYMVPTYESSMMN